MFCSHCGARLADDAKFCPSCGQVVTSSASRVPKPRRRRWLVAGGIVAALAIVAVVVIVVTTSRGSGATPSGSQESNDQGVASTDNPGVSFFPEGTVLSDRGVGSGSADEVGWLYSFKFENTDGRTRVTIGGDDGEGDIEPYFTGYATQDGANSDGPIWRLDSLLDEDGYPASDIEVKFQVPAGLKDGSVEGVWRVQFTYPDDFDGSERPNLVTYFNADGTFNCAGCKDHAVIDDPMTLEEMYKAGSFWGVYNSWVLWTQDDDGRVELSAPDYGDDHVSTQWVELDF